MTPDQHIFFYRAIAFIAIFFAVKCNIKSFASHIVTVEWKKNKTQNNILFWVLSAIDWSLWSPDWLYRNDHRHSEHRHYLWDAHEFMDFFNVISFHSISVCMLSHFGHSGGGTFFICCKLFLLNHSVHTNCLNCLVLVTIISQSDDTSLLVFFYEKRLKRDLWTFTKKIWNRDKEDK